MRNATQAATPNAKSNQTLRCANAALSLLHRLRERGWGVLVGNKSLAPPPGPTPSHEISPGQTVQDPGAMASGCLWGSLKRFHNSNFRPNCTRKVKFKSARRHCRDLVSQRGRNLQSFPRSMESTCNVDRPLKRGSPEGSTRIATIVVLTD